MCAPVAIGMKTMWTPAGAVLLSACSWMKWALANWLSGSLRKYCLWI